MSKIELGFYFSDVVYAHTANLNRSQDYCCPRLTAWCSLLSAWLITEVYVCVWIYANKSNVSCRNGIRGEDRLNIWGFMRCKHLSWAISYSDLSCRPTSNKFMLHYALYIPSVKRVTQAWSYKKDLSGTALLLQLLSHCGVTEEATRKRSTS